MGKASPPQATPDLGSELFAHSCELCSENTLKFPFPVALFLQVFNLSLQMKCAVEKKMLITQLLRSAPATEKFITICPGLDRAVSIKTLTSLKQWQTDSALQQGTASSPRRPCKELAGVWYRRGALCSLLFTKVRGKKSPCCPQNFCHFPVSVILATFWCLMVGGVFSFCQPFN